MRKIKFLNILGLGSITLFTHRFINPFLFKNDVSCVCKGVTGIPCPSCGLTRASIAVLNNDYSKAWEMHPLIFFLPFFALIAAFLHFKGYKKSLQILMIIILIAFILVWLIRMFFMFPNTAPLDFYNDALLVRLLRAFKIIK